MFNFCWMFFVSHILAVPFIINFFSRDFYGPTTPTIYTIITVAHIIRGVAPSLFVLLWLFKESVFYTICKPAIVLYYCSLLIGAVFGCVYGVIFPSVFLPIFQLFWVSLSVPFVAICLRKTTEEDSAPANNISTSSSYYNIGYTDTPALSSSIVILDVPAPKRLEMSQISDIENGDVCCICLDILNDDLMDTICHHRFHLKCILEWVRKGRRICPLCNQDLKTGKLPPLLV